MRHGADSDPNERQLRVDISPVSLARGRDRKAASVRRARKELKWVKEWLEDKSSHRVTLPTHEGRLVITGNWLPEGCFHRW